MSDSIYKKLTNALFKLSGGQAMPSAEVVSVSKTSDNNYVAPSDGYFTLDGEQAIGNGSYLHGTSSGLALITASLQGQGAKLYSPAKKGSTVFLFASQYTSSNISFTKLVGGGLTAFWRWLSRGFGEVCYVC